METIAFNDKNFALLSSGIGWCSVACPHCANYHSQNFIPTLERGKSSSMVACKLCGSVVEVVADIRFVDRVIARWEAENNRMEERIRRKGNKPWQVEIEVYQTHSGAEAISVQVTGRSAGMGSSHLSRKAAIAAVREYLKSEDIQEKDCDFFSGITTRSEIFGGQNLLNFF